MNDPSPQNSGQEVHLDPQELVSESLRKATSMALPAAIHHRLDFLAELAKSARTSRAEIISMLIADAPEDRVQLVQAILDYRERTIQDVLAPDERVKGAKNVVVPLRGRGRPPRSAGT